MPKAQEKKIKELFTSRPFEWIPVFVIQNHALQYNARIFTLRHKGMQIENKIKTIDGARHSCYRYIPNREAQTTLF